MLLGPVVDRPVNHPLVPPLQAPEPPAAPSLAPAQTLWSLSHCRHQSQLPFAQIWSVMRLLTSWPHSTFRATRHRSVWFHSAQMLCVSCFHLPGLFPLPLKWNSAPFIAHPNSQSLKTPSQIPALPFNRQLTWTKLLKLPGISHICKIGKVIITSKESNERHHRKKCLVNL